MRPSVALALALLVVGASGANASAKPAVPGSGLDRVGDRAEFVSGELVVRFRAGVPAAARGDALEAREARAMRGLGLPGLTLVRLPRGASVRAAAAAFERDPRVLYAEPNYLHRLLEVPPNDPFFLQQWGLDQLTDRDIDAPEAWDIATGSSTVVVAVLDSGIDLSHPDLMSNIWVNDDPPGGGDDDLNNFIDDTNGWDFIQDDAMPLDYNGHGTHVAGTIGAVGNNSLGVAGVNWDVSLMAVRVASADGTLPSAAIANGINYACANDADVVNGSFGARTKSLAVRDAVKSPACADTLFVFAAGNEGRNLNGNTAASNEFPCELHRPPSGGGNSAANVICVAASNMNDGLAGFSNRGRMAVHLAAPGVDILSTVPAYQEVTGFPEGFDYGTPGEFQAQWNDQLGPGAEWAQSFLNFTSSPASLRDSPGNYPNDSERSIRNMSPIDLSGLLGCRIDYEIRLATEFRFDFFVISAGTTTDADTDVTAWTGSTAGQFIPATDDLSLFDGQMLVYIRFWLISDPSVRMDGVYLDDFVVKCLAPGQEAYEAIAGTSMATPHVAGVAALLLDFDPLLTVPQLKSAILRGVDRRSGLANLVSTGGRLNAADSLSVLTDVTAPETTITGRPANQTSSHRATFRFTADEPGSRFQCRHMNGPWTGCSSPKVYRNLANGLHRLRVRAIDKAGNVDSTPAQDTWRIV